MSKTFSPILIFVALTITVLADYSFGQANSGQLLTYIVGFIFAPFPAQVAEPSLLPVPFYQHNQNATYILIVVSISILIYVFTREIRRVKIIGQNKLSACTISLSACLLFFNVMLGVWNT